MFALLGMYLFIYFGLIVSSYIYPRAEFVCLRPRDTRIVAFCLLPTWLVYNAFMFNL